MKWYVTTKSSCVAEATFDSLDEAIEWVHQHVVRGVGRGMLDWRVQTDGSGRPDFASWSVPDREMKRKEIYAAAPDSRVRRRWMSIVPRVPDWDRADGLVEFVGQRVGFVQISREDRERDYIIGSDHSGNRKGAQARSLMNFGETDPRIASMAARDE